MPYEVFDDEDVDYSTSPKKVKNPTKAPVSSGSSKYVMTDVDEPFEREPRKKGKVKSKPIDRPTDEKYAIIDSDDKPIAKNSKVTREGSDSSTVSPIPPVPVVPKLGRKRRRLPPPPPPKEDRCVKETMRETLDKVPLNLHTNTVEKIRNYLQQWKRDWTVCKSVFMVVGASGSGKSYCVNEALRGFGRARTLDSEGMHGGAGSKARLKNRLCNLLNIGVEDDVANVLVIDGLEMYKAENNLADIVKIVADHKCPKKTRGKGKVTRRKCNPVIMVCDDPYKLGRAIYPLKISMAKNSTDFVKCFSPTADQLARLCSKYVEDNIAEVRDRMTKELVMEMRTLLTEPDPLEKIRSAFFTHTGSHMPKEWSAKCYKQVAAHVRQKCEEVKTTAIKNAIANYGGNMSSTINAIELSLNTLSSGAVRNKDAKLELFSTLSMVFLPVKERNTDVMKAVRTGVYKGNERAFDRVYMDSEPVRSYCDQRNSERWNNCDSLQDWVYFNSYKSEMGHQIMRAYADSVHMPDEYRTDIRRYATMAHANQTGQNQRGEFPYKSGNESMVACGGFGVGDREGYEMLMAMDTIKQTMKMTGKPIEVPEHFTPEYELGSYITLNTEGKLQRVNIFDFDGSRKCTTKKARGNTEGYAHPSIKAQGAIKLKPLPEPAPKRRRMR